jgi:hypothetical protein
MTREEAQKASGYIIPGEWGYVPVGSSAFFIVKGNEIHCWRDPSVAGRWISRSDIHNVTAPLLQKFGCVFTSVENDNIQGQRFVRRLGFVESFRSPSHVFYVSTHMAHCKESEQV